MKELTDFWWMYAFALGWKFDSVTLLQANWLPTKLPFKDTEILKAKYSSEPWECHWWLYSKMEFKNLIFLKAFLGGKVERSSFCVGFGMSTIGNMICCTSHVSVCCSIN